MYSELKSVPRQKAMDDAAAIFNTVKSIINMAQTENTTTIQAANKLAIERIGMVSAIHRMHIP